MPIIGLQRRLREAGRIRLGEQRVSARGNAYPAALNTFRFTSADRAAIDAAAALWGGKVTPWDSPAGPQWQVTIEAAAITVVVPPTDLGFSQWYEMWSAGGCQRRCDGHHEHLSDSPCLCDPDNRACSPCTRASVMVPQLPGFSLWRLESHGYYAATELAGVVDIINRAAAQGRFLEAQLRIDQRVAKRLDDKGDIVTQHYVVPVLDLGLTFRELVGAPTAQALPAADSAGGAEGQAHSPAPTLTPVPDLPAGPSVEDQLAQLREQPPHKLRGPLPTSGVDPETGEITEPRPEPEPAPAPEGKGMAPPPASTTDPEVARRRVMAEATKTWPDATTEQREGLRHALGVMATYTSRHLVEQPPTQSVNDMTLDERLRLSTLLADVRMGRMALDRVEDDDAGHHRYRASISKGARVAVLTRLAHDDWDVDIHVPDRKEAQP